MNYEQKYNQILEWARKNKARLNGVPIEEVLPELAESEDERIRWWLRSYFGTIGKNWLFDNEMPLNSILAWLEKQKEQKPKESYTLADLEAEWKHGYDFAKKEAETAYTGDEDKADL